jgi:hypothetical protein
MTVIVLPAAGDPAAEPDGVGVPPDGAHAVITIEKTKAIAASSRVDRIKAHLLCGLVQYLPGDSYGEPH